MDHPTVNLLKLSERDLAGLPIRGINAIALRSALRALPIYTAWSTSIGDTNRLNAILEQAVGVLRGSQHPDSLLELAETAYQLAAVAATEFRIRRSDQAGRAAAAGMIIHSAIDALADIEVDPQASTINAVLAFRGTAKLRDAELINAVNQDLQLLLLCSEQTTWTELEPFGELN